MSKLLVNSRESTITSDGRTIAVRDLKYDNPRPTFDEWMDWARNNDIDPAIRLYLEMSRKESGTPYGDLYCIGTRCLGRQPEEGVKLAPYYWNNANELIKNNCSSDCRLSLLDYVYQDPDTHGMWNKPWFITGFMVWLTEEVSVRFCNFLKTKRKEIGDGYARLGGSDMPRPTFENWILWANMSRGFATTNGYIVPWIIPEICRYLEISKTNCGNEYGDLYADGVVCPQNWLALSIKLSDKIIVLSGEGDDMATLHESYVRDETSFKKECEEILGENVAERFVKFVENNPYCRKIHFLTRRGY